MNDNIYYNPEKFGFKVIGASDTAESYEYNTLVVFQRESDGNLFYAQDSGCSCPTPFDEVRPEDITPILDSESFWSIAKNHRPYSYYETLEEKLNWYSESLDLYMKVKNILG